MQAIAVLADQILQHPPVLQLHERHVCKRRHRLQRVNRTRALLSLRSQRPYPVRTTKIGDSYSQDLDPATSQLRSRYSSGWRERLTSRRGDTCPREDHHVLALPYQLRQRFRLSVNDLRRLLTFLCRDFGRGVGHFGWISVQRNFELILGYKSDVLL